MIRNIRLTFISIVAAAGLAACTTTEDKNQSNQLAAEAAATTMPSVDAASTDSSSLAVVVDRANNSMKIYNFGKQAVSDAEIFINGNFYFRAGNLPPMGYTQYDLHNFFDRSGKSLSQVDVRVNSVQVRSDGKLWNLMGPVNN